MRRARGEAGQATSEYVALLALVGIVLLSAVGLTAGGLGAQVLHGIRLGLCAVAGTACPPAPAPRADLPACPLERRVQQEQLSETLGVVRLGSTGTLTAVRRSDGRVTVTLADGSRVGAEVGVGVRLALGGRGRGAELGAGGELTWGSGRSWHFPDAAAARAFVARYGAKATIGGKLVDQLRSRCSLLCDALGWRPHPPLPPPDETHREGGATGRLTAAFGLGRRAEAGAEASGLLGRRETRAGETTWYFRLSAALAARLRLPGAELAAGGEAAAVVAYRVAADGRPLELVVATAGEGGGRGALRPAAARDGGEVRGGERRERAVVVELDATLDLADAGNRAAARALVDALTDPDASPARRARAAGARLAALGRRLATHGRLDLRTYALARRGRSVGGTVALGLKLGGALDRTTRELRLLDARTRLPGLPFLPRHDCAGP